MISEHMMVLRVGPYEGAIAEATGTWPAEGIYLVTVAGDVAEWLLALV